MKRLLDPLATTGGAIPTVSTQPPPPTSVATVSHTNTFVRVLTSDAKELFVAVDDDLKAAVTGLPIKADESSVVGKLAQAETKHPQTTLIIIALIVVAVIALGIAFLHGL